MRHSGFVALSMALPIAQSESLQHVFIVSTGEMVVDRALVNSQSGGLKKGLNLGLFFIG